MRQSAVVQSSPVLPEKWETASQKLCSRRYPSFAAGFAGYESDRYSGAPGHRQGRSEESQVATCEVTVLNGIS